MIFRIIVPPDGLPQMLWFTLQNTQMLKGPLKVLYLGVSKAPLWLEMLRDICSQANISYVGCSLKRRICPQVEKSVRQDKEAEC